MIKPKALKLGDTIGVIAPASPAGEEKTIEAKKVLSKMGFKVKMGESCYSTHGYLAGTDELRAKDLNNMFEDKEIDGIICLRGGYGTPKILEQLNYDMIAQNPKVFVGYSDITAIHIALNQKCNLITFHGPMVASNMISKLDEFTYDSFEKNIMNDNIIGNIKNPEGENIESLVGGRAEGKLIGGNLALICATIGTPYEIDTKDKVLFLEDIGEEPFRVDRMLTQLLLSGKLRDAKGIILGDWNNCEADEPEESLSLMEVFEEILKPLKKPIIYNLRSGHCTPMITLPFGVKVKLDADAREVNIEEGAVI